MNDNTKIYKKVLNKMLKETISSDLIYSELILPTIRFEPDGLIEGSSEKYLQNEFNWYKSQDLCIKNHLGIEENPIWKNCASDDGYVNSNYGWCVFSKDNYSQFDNALNSLLKDKESRRAVIIYTRPNIHVEQCDNVHAKQDMMCTTYTDFLIRDNKLIMIVHMRSNDVWYGLRYDLAWQQHVYNKMYDSLKEKYDDLLEGYIYWNCDSLHMYKSSVDKIKKFLDK